MAVWGVSSRLDDGEAYVVAIEVIGPRASASGREVFRHRSNPEEDWAQKLRSLSADFEAALKRGTPDALIVRSMDWTRFRTETTARKRYQIEGALLATARRRVTLVEAASGKAIADQCGVKKAEVEAEATGLFGAEVKEAGAAALAALDKAGQA